MLIAVPSFAYFHIFLFLTTEKGSIVSIEAEGRVCCIQGHTHCLGMTFSPDSFADVNRIKLQKAMFGAGLSGEPRFGFRESSDNRYETKITVRYASS